MSEEEVSPIVAEAQADVAEAVRSPVARSDSSSSTDDSDVRRGRRRRRNYQLRVLRAHSRSPPRNRLVDNQVSSESGSSGSDSPPSDSDSSQVNFKVIDYYGVYVLLA